MTSRIALQGKESFLFGTLGSEITKLSSFKRLLKTAIEKTVELFIFILPPRLRLILRLQSEMTTPLDYRHAHLRIVVDSETELHLRSHSCAREPELLSWLDTFLRDGDVLYDVGANAGAYSLIAASLPGKRITVVAFEPAATNYAQLARNIVLNGLGDRVSAYQVALSDATEILTFNYSTLETGAALHETSRRDTNGSRPSVYSQPVLAFPLSYFSRTLGLPAPNHVKVDVDGGERAVIAGMALEDPLLRTIFIELEDEAEDSAWIKSTLLASGFRLDRAIQQRACYAVTGKFSNCTFVR